MSNADLNQFRKELNSDDGQKVQLNKGHFSLDSEERTQEFSKKKCHMDGKKQYHDYREQWEKNPENKIIRDYPLLVDIELAQYNLCPMCYTTTKHFKETVRLKLMPRELFIKVADELEVSTVRLSLRGESTPSKIY